MRPIVLAGRRPTPVTGGGTAADRAAAHSTAFFTTAWRTPARTRGCPTTGCRAGRWSGPGGCRSTHPWPKWSPSSGTAAVPGRSAANGRSGSLRRSSANGRLAAAAGGRPAAGRAARRGTRPPAVSCGRSCRTAADPPQASISSTPPASTYARAAAASAGVKSCRTVPVRTAIGTRPGAAPAGRPLHVQAGVRLPLEVPGEPRPGVRLGVPLAGVPQPRHGQDPAGRVGTAGRTATPAGCGSRSCRPRRRTGSGPARSRPSGVRPVQLPPAGHVGRAVDQQHAATRC